jgi:hypothetical protein
MRRACLASGHAGETDPVHGGAHQVPTRPVVTHVQLRESALRVLNKNMKQYINVFEGAANKMRQFRLHFFRYEAKRETLTCTPPRTKTNKWNLIFS